MVARDRELQDLPDLPTARLAELACPHCGVIAAWPRATATLRAYAALAAALGFSPRITSGYRCAWYNGSIAGAASDSTHVAGIGLDLVGDAVSRARILDLAADAGFSWTRGDPEKGYVHVDTR